MHIIKDKMSYANSLLNFSFSYTFQQGNTLAYALAQRARIYLSFIGLDEVYFYCPLLIAL